MDKSCVFPPTDNATLAELAQTITDGVLGFLNNMGFNSTSIQDLFNNFINSQPTTNWGDILKSVLDAAATVGNEFKTSLDYMLDTMGEENIEAIVKSLAENLEKVKEEVVGKDRGDDDNDY